MVGLFGYLIKGVHDAGVPIDISLATALFVPLAVVMVWWVVRRVQAGISRRGITKEVRHAASGSILPIPRQEAGSADRSSAENLPLLHCSRIASLAERTASRPRVSERLAMCGIMLRFDFTGPA